MSPPDPLFELGRAVARRQDAWLDAADPDPVTRKRVAQFAGQASSRRPPRPRRALWAMAAAVFVAALIGGKVLRREPAQAPALTFSVGSPPNPGAPGELAVAPAGRTVPIIFSEGTSVLLEPDARARVVALGPHGADLILESGRAHLDVVPRPHGEWSVRAGPFAVRVKGTRFDVAYDPRTDAFSLTLHEGKVVVTGCGFGEGRAVDTGEHVEGSCEHHEAPPAVATAPAPAETAAAPPLERRPGRPNDAPAVAEARPSSKEAGRTWLDWARSGYYAEAYELTRGAFDAECQRHRAEDVLLLGDTARLSGHAAEARRAYAEVRNRFPGSAEAAQAAFALGRLALRSDEDRAAAERWFEANLRERPNGPMAGVALGRLLELRLARGDRAGAEAAARDYLRRFPEGPYAPAARKLASEGL